MTAPVLAHHVRVRAYHASRYRLAVDPEARAYHLRQALYHDARVRRLKEGGA